VKCCAEDKAPVAILHVGKFKFKQKMDGRNPQTTFSRNCKFVKANGRKPCTALNHKRQNMYSAAHECTMTSTIIQSITDIFIKK
jgi:hypothetical protein